MRNWIAAAVYLALATGANAADTAALEAMREGTMKKLALHDAPRAAPEVAITGPEGEVRLADFAGELVVLNFWATWCAPCRKEMPALANLHDSLEGNGGRVVAVATGRTPEGAVRRFLDEIGVTDLPIYYDPRQALASQMGVLGLPVTVILDREGREVARLTGDAEWDSESARAIIDALKAE